MLVVVAVLKAAEGKGDELEKEFLKLLPLVKEKEPNTLSYRVNRDLKDSTRFIVYEQYKGNEDLTFHSSTPYFKEFGKAAASLLAGRAEIMLCREIG